MSLRRVGDSAPKMGSGEVGVYVSQISVSFSEELCVELLCSFK